MKLRLIVESFNKLLKLVADRDGISPENLLYYVKAADPTGKQHGFILKLLKDRKIRLPEDKQKTLETIANFEKYKSKLEIRDINRYSSLQQIQDAVEPYVGSTSKKSGDIGITWKNMPGVSVIARNGSVTTIAVSDVNTLAEIGEGTQWCTRKSYPDCMAERYLEHYDHINVVMVGNTPTIQYTPDYDQVMDRDDVDIRYRETADPVRDGYDAVVPDEKLLRLIPFEMYRDPVNVSSKQMVGYEAKLAFEYMKNIGCYIDKTPSTAKAMGLILRSPRWAYHYAYEVLHQRWPDAEKIIAANPYFACKYLMNVIFGGQTKTMVKQLPPKSRRWVDAEPLIYGSDYEEAYDQFVRDGVMFDPSQIMNAHGASADRANSPSLM